MGEARRRKKALGFAYGTPAGTKKKVGGSGLPPIALEAASLWITLNLLSKEHAREIAELMHKGPKNWTRSYPAVKWWANKVDQIDVVCVGDLVSYSIPGASQELLDEIKKATNHVLAAIGQ
jgi:hypothetical protein